MAPLTDDHVSTDEPPRATPQPEPAATDRPDTDVRPEDDTRSADPDGSAPDGQPAGEAPPGPPLAVGEDPLRPPPEVGPPGASAGGQPGPVYTVAVLLLLSAALALLRVVDDWSSLWTLLTEWSTVWERADGDLGLLTQLYLRRLWLVVYGVACVALGLLVARGRAAVFWGAAAVMVAHVAVTVLHLLTRDGAQSYVSTATEFVYPVVILALLWTPASRAYFTARRGS